MSRKLASPMKWQQFAVITTTSAFDVLNRMRYDRATFAREEDARAFEAFIGNPGVYRSIRFMVTRWSEAKTSLWSSIWRADSCLKFEEIDDFEWAARDDDRDKSKVELVRHDTPAS